MFTVVHFGSSNFMKTKFISSLLAGLLLACAAAAQTPVAPGPETALRALSKETDPLTQIQMLLEFEKNFPNSNSLLDVYQLLLSLLHQRDDKIKIEEVGERALKSFPDDFTTLLTVSHNYGLQKKNLDRAVQYAQKAVEVLARQKGEQRYQDDPKWKAFIDSVTTAAKANLNWINSLIH